MKHMRRREAKLMHRGPDGPRSFPATVYSMDLPAWDKDSETCEGGAVAGARLAGDHRRNQPLEAS
jgi:hypothetical protein